MKKTVFALAAVVLLVALASAAFAEIAPIGWEGEPTPIRGLLNHRMFLRKGPGVKYFAEIGGAGEEGEYVSVFAKAWDPNNGIWWVKVEYPKDSGVIGWTPYSRFQAKTVPLDKLPTEYFYPNP